MMKLIYYSSLVCLALLVSSCQQQEKLSLNEYQWQTLECTGEPVARHEAAFVEANGEFYGFYEMRHGGIGNGDRDLNGHFQGKTAFTHRRFDSFHG